MTLLLLLAESDSRGRGSASDGGILLRGRSRAVREPSEGSPGSGEVSRLGRGRDGGGVQDVLDRLPTLRVAVCLSLLSLCLSVCLSLSLGLSLSLRLRMGERELLLLQLVLMRLSGLLLSLHLLLEVGGDGSG